MDEASKLSLSFCRGLDDAICPSSLAASEPLSRTPEQGIISGNSCKKSA